MAIIAAQKRFGQPESPITVQIPRSGHLGNVLLNGTSPAQPSFPERDFGGVRGYTSIKLKMPTESAAPKITSKA
jgi:hypothetical protein